MHLTVKEETFFRNRWKALEQELDQIASESLDDKL